MSGEGITTGYYLRIGHATANIGKCRQQYASVNAVCDLCCGQCPNNISQTAGFKQREHL